MLVSPRLITPGLIVLLLVSACGSSPPVHYFSLEPIDAAYTQDPDDALMLGLGPLRMPEYLNRSQIVTRSGGMELRVDEFSRWAEPLTLALHRIVSTNVDYLMDGVIVIAYPYEPIVRRQVDYRLIGDVLRFDADRSGRVVLEAQWGIAEVGAETVVSPRRSRYEARAATADDPGAVAAAMNEALAQFSRDIASRLEAALPE